MNTWAKPITWLDCSVAPGIDDDAQISNVDGLIRPDNFAEQRPLIELAG